MARKGLIHGDSITQGSNATTPQLAYPALLGGILGIDILTNASSGRTVQESVLSWNATNSLENVIYNPTIAQQLYNPIIEYDSIFDFLLFRLGVNDCLQKPGSSTSVMTFKDTYKRCLKFFINSGWPANIIHLVNIGSYLGWTDEVKDAVIVYNTAISELCLELGLTLIDLNSFDKQHVIAELYSDDVHPNNLGHMEHAQFIASELQKEVNPPSGNQTLYIKHGRFTIS